METAFVFPKSKKAKNRFANLMDSIEEVIIEQKKGDEVFVTSQNGKNHFWVNLNDDKDWSIEF
jgi:predicted nucleic acid-binding Zn finger protein